MSTSIEGMALHLVHALMMWLNHELITWKQIVTKRDCNCSWRWQW
jgi:hypothetical protein